MARVIKAPRIASSQRTLTADTPYPSDILPGARDVETSYGVMRVYEWGHGAGDKVLLIHGDTTPSPMLGPMAHLLVEKGHHVMLFDLWGRGYSDSPLDTSHDLRAFKMQILFALASSELSWTGSSPGGFRVIGFSLGGAIAMSFAAEFPYLVRSVVLLAPGGILRRLPQQYEWFCSRYPWLSSKDYLRRRVGQVLGVNADKKQNETLKVETDRPRDGATQASRPDESQDVAGIVQWQFDHHLGFIHSFIDTIRQRPAMYQHHDWQQVCDIIKGSKQGCRPESKSPSPLYGGKLLVITGADDSIVVGAEIEEDVQAMFGSDADKHLLVESMPGTHGFPVPNYKTIVDTMMKLWQ